MARVTDVEQVRRVPAAGRAVFWTQFALLIAYLIGSFGILILAAVHVGDPGAVLHPGLDRLGDPKDSMLIGPDSVWNPLVWIVGVCRLIAWFVYPLGFAMLLFGGATMVHTWRLGDRRTFTQVAVLTAIWLILIILAASPYGSSLTTWLLD
ncbi:hypothetical protein Acy02nite_07530 [Actinoplanes cyaneus]|uniref:Uncharacterized protein n=1 Tax=Actinoplanes cyaneus TaxID=52696 RepID=A0A919M1X4_9ACTN|nr:hypothetical protein [Actinoplanes cyaneus]GID62872.1 hypothetical protein Acy02nite_07530 [Actinoplanes cyaneus]